ncbi:MAG: YARHG domain-containing protein [Clostridia bacterium]|nr:YARHG domain-containing protein [Clostridia bacterium]
MKKNIAMILCCLMVLVSAVASACGPYVLIEDSNTRLLTERELREYSYDALGYALNEIVARHGYHFDENGKYADHFSHLFCEADEDVSNAEIYAGLSNVEYANMDLIKKVRADLRAENADLGPEPGLWSCSEEDYDPALEVPYIGSADWFFKQPHLNIPVYSGPGEYYLRGANGRACLSTNEDVLAYGWDGEWLMVTYLIDEGHARVGYIHNANFTAFCEIPALDFEYTPSILTADAMLTDDPAGTQAGLKALHAGDPVTVLTTYPQEGWIYVEVDGKTPVRGFIPAACL